MSLHSNPLLLAVRRCSFAIAGAIPVIAASLGLIQCGGSFSGSGGGKVSGGGFSNGGVTDGTQGGYTSNGNVCGGFSGHGGGDGGQDRTNSTRIKFRPEKTIRLQTRNNEKLEKNSPMKLPRKKVVYPLGKIV
ncbi:hypothetical protein IFM89_035409 [Coptis chinensis]|uniref:Uncharacterized protein n=1 Tax=Coptis chinensis TaxID=261450 RepID=A0A835HH57_9MAGN|nr:hypothetical protein IFM89_035409 [Coptis chinensis]